MNKNGYKEKILELTSGKCRGCDVCNGVFCVGSIPGMGGINDQENFIANYESWSNLDVENLSELPKIGLAPITGAVQNIGYIDEREFYFKIIESAKYADIDICIGDGCPDEKLLFGIEAMKNFNCRGASILKPYLNRELFKRIEYVSDISDFIGVDIDSYRIVTMAGQVSMEKKDAEKLLEIKKKVKTKFLIKGICDLDGVELIKKVKPEIVVISNHGGRVAAPNIGTGYLLKSLAPLLKNYVKEIWVDGGLRDKSHLQKAKQLGAEKVLIARPFIQATFGFGKKGIKTILEKRYGYGKVGS